METAALVLLARRGFILAAGLLGLAAITASIPDARGAAGAPSGTLLCTGALSQGSGVDWGKSTLEFSLAYAPGAVSPLKSDVALLNAPLRIDLDETDLKASEAPARMPTPEGNRVEITQLQVSRQTGKFSLHAAVTRESSGVVVGTGTWEGTCIPDKALERKF